MQTVVVCINSKFFLTFQFDQKHRDYNQISRPETPNIAAHSQMNWPLVKTANPEWKTEVWKEKVVGLLKDHPGRLLQYINMEPPSNWNNDHKCAVEHLLMEMIRDSAVKDRMKAAGWSAENKNPLETFCRGVIAMAQIESEPLEDQREWALTEELERETSKRIVSLQKLIVDMGRLLGTKHQC